MLPNSASIKSSSDFQTATKLGRRFTGNSLIGYLYSSNSDQPAKLGLIVGKSVGNSVVRHRIARQIRHASFNYLSLLPTGSLLVIRAMKRSHDAFTETKALFEKLIGTTKNLKDPKDQVRV